MRTPDEQESPQVYDKPVFFSDEPGSRTNQALQMNQGFLGKEVLKKEGAEEASNLMRRPVKSSDRYATTSACVGWDVINI